MCGYQLAHMDTKSEESEEMDQQINGEISVGEANPSDSDFGDVEEAEIVVESPELNMEQEMLKWRDAAMRSGAELENFRKRMVREKSDAIRYASQSLLEDLLPVIDNFEMGLMAAEKDQDSMIFMGMKMVKDQLARFLENQGVKIVPTDGAFDPNLHEALSEEASTEVEPGQIIRVQRKGYLLQDRLIRAAAVVVAKEEV